VYAVLAKRNVALCIAEAGDELKVPRVATADWGYLRLRLEQYSAADLKKWIKWIREQKWSEAFIYFRHEDTGTGPRFGKQLIELAG
jgi:uncharacterized protein YecE (DUF72 family)